MSTLEPAEVVALRSMIRDAIQELVPRAQQDGVASGDIRSAPDEREAQPTVETVSGDKAVAVTISSDADLRGFVERVLHLTEDPKSRSDLASGRMRFTLFEGSVAAVAPTLRYVPKGAVTESLVKEASAAGVGLRLGRRAVLTPLARDKARALGVVIEREP